VYLRKWCYTLESITRGFQATAKNCSRSIRPCHWYKHGRVYSQKKIPITHCLEVELSFSIKLANFIKINNFLLTTYCTVRVALWYFIERAIPRLEDRKYPHHVYTLHDATLSNTRERLHPNKYTSKPRFWQTRNRAFATETFHVVFFNRVKWQNDKKEIRKSISDFTYT
jgi:hypothetical protein